MTRVYWYPGLHSLCLQKSALNSRASGISMAGKILVSYLHCLGTGMRKLVKIWECKVMLLSLVMLSQRKVFDHWTLNFCNLFWIIVPHLRNLDRTSFFIWCLQNCCRWHGCYVIAHETANEKPVVLQDSEKRCRNLLPLACIIPKIPPDLQDVYSLCLLEKKYPFVLNRASRPKGVQGKPPHCQVVGVDLGKGLPKHRRTSCWVVT